MSRTTCTDFLLVNALSHANVICSVWQQITNSLRDIGTVFSDIPAVSKGLKKFQLKLVTPAAEKIGWDFPEGEDLLTGRLRALLISQAGLAGHEK